MHTKNRFAEIRREIQAKEKEVEVLQSLDSKLGKGKTLNSFLYSRSLFLLK